MKLKTAIFIISCTIIVLLSSIYFIADHTLPKEVISIDFDFNVSNTNIGFNLDADKMHFGRIHRESQGTRKIKIGNDADYPQRAEILIASKEQEQIQDWFTVTPNWNYRLQPKQTETFLATLTIPKEAEYKTYEGAFVIYLYKDWPWKKS
ncbi:hypothetical protein COV20_03555 [Candidatus Woesearchaeota archaeon CG10_big_fil_rev_8_21_14_0_10_45_16]|nr:MAG: hypothetical protein COV20_03555 [Candidatus Woesearchaeota archaeon CG10_big_fil_rev_8_21_14_0_10_45_16]